MNVCIERLATACFSTPQDRIASPLQCLVRKVRHERLLLVPLGLAKRDF